MWHWQSVTLCLFGVDGDYEQLASCCCGYHLTTGATISSVAETMIRTLPFTSPNGAWDLKLWVGRVLHSCCESVPVLCCSFWQAGCVLYSCCSYAMHIGTVPCSIHNPIIFNYRTIVASLSLCRFLAHDFYSDGYLAHAWRKCYETRFAMTNVKGTNIYVVHGEFRADARTHWTLPGTGSKISHQ